MRSIPASSTGRWPVTVTTTGRSRRRLPRPVRPVGRGSLHAEQVHHENERLMGLDRAGGTLGAVTEVWRDGQLAPPAHLHSGHALVPTRDDPAGAEREAE